MGASYALGRWFEPNFRYKDNEVQHTSVVTGWRMNFSLLHVMSFIIRVVIFLVSWCSGSTVSFGLTRGGSNPSETTDRWCKWCARWTENPEVLVQLKVDP